MSLIIISRPPDEVTQSWNDYLFLLLILICACVIVPIIVLSLIESFKNRNKPKKYKLVRTKNPYRRYKRINF